MSGFANRLIQETSPYLLQHAHNPVHWYPWCEEALSIAKKENKPVLISIGYAACHWCHVMERESFESEETAAYMNAHFVNIKIDREERPDLDHIYMDAVQTLTGSGGWPLHVFLTPEGKPFYGGTYFPPVRAYHRPSWTEVLEQVRISWTEKKEEVLEQANHLLAHIEKLNPIKNSLDNNLFSQVSLQSIAANSLAIADTKWGGFGKAPKFPQSFTVLFLLRYYHFTRHEPALQQALLSLNKMMQGGIYDQLGGGFARYSTDSEWLAPHFEKMLYDNALLISVYCEALQLTKNSAYQKLIEETLEFVQRELLLPEGGFGSALDADSEGVEGKFYTWTAEEINEGFGETEGTSSELLSAFYNIQPQGNWEHTNILWIPQPLVPFCEERLLDLEKTKELLAKGTQQLLKKREERKRPLFDDKILLGWNALMNKACSKAYAVTGNDSYRELAVRNMEFLLKRFTDKESFTQLENDHPLKPSAFFHTYKREARFPAFLDDLAFLAEAMIYLQEITANSSWLKKAENLVGHILENFTDPHSPFFYFTPVGQSDIIVRKKEIYDGATPSGNSVMANVLHKLSLLLDKPDWGKRSREMLEALGDISLKHPLSFGNWNCLLQEIVLETNEITLTGPASLSHQKELLAAYIPHRVLRFSTQTDVSFPFVKSKIINPVAAFSLCKSQSCLPPVETQPELMALIDQLEGR